MGSILRTPHLVLSLFKMINTEIARLKTQIKLFETIEPDPDVEKDIKEKTLLWSSFKILELAKRLVINSNRRRDELLFILFAILIKRHPKIKNLIKIPQMFEVYLIVPNLYKELVNCVLS
jgi:hypothetical protein